MFQNMDMLFLWVISCITIKFAISETINPIPVSKSCTAKAIAGKTYRRLDSEAGMDNWKAWAVLFLSVCVMVAILAYYDYVEVLGIAVSAPFALGIVCAFLGYLRRGREIRHQERLAMIEKGIYIEARRHESGIPSLAVVFLVGIGLATVIASDVEFFGFALLFVGIGLIVRSRLLHHRKKEQEGLTPTPAEGPPRVEEQTTTEKNEV